MNAYVHLYDRMNNQVWSATIVLVRTFLSPEFQRNLIGFDNIVGHN